MENETKALITEEKTKEVSFLKAVEDVVRKGSYSGALSIGLKESTRAIEQREAYLCFMARNCGVKEYKDLVEKLCLASHCDLVIVPDKKQLGLWCGLDKKLMGLKERKKHDASCVVLTKITEDSESFKMIVDQFSKLPQGKKIITVQGEDNKKVDTKKGKGDKRKENTKGGHKKKEDNKGGDKKKK